MQKSDFIKFIINLKAVLPKWAPAFSDDASFSLWFDPFKNHDIELMRKVYVYCRDNLDEFPSIKSLLSICEELSGDLPQSPFDEIIGIVRRFGSNEGRWPQLNPAMRELISRLGGGESIGEWQDEHRHFKRKMVDEMWPEIIAQYRMGHLEHKYQPSLAPADIMRMIEERPTQPQKKLSLIRTLDEIRSNVRK